MIVQMALSTQPYKGARDFYPEDKRLQKYIFKKWRAVAERYGYEEYDAPIIEPLEIYLSKTSEEIVNEQTYAFKDRGDRNVVIRPEMTPTVSRMVAARRQELAYPLRWYSIPNVWRYERPQRGRLREHWQLNVDLFGIEDAQAELEIISMAHDLMSAFGAKADMYKIRINSRRLMNSVMKDYLGLDSVQSQTLARLIDHMPKMDHATFAGELDALFTPTQRETGKSDQLLDLLRVKSLDELPAAIKDSSSVKELSRLFAQLSSGGVSNAVFDPSLMRGFDYYTDIVFEVFDTNPENNRSLFGGGRYDGLVEQFGAEKLASVGFGMGDVTLLNFLDTHSLLPTLPTETDIYAVPLGEVASQAQGVVSELREMGLNVALAPSGRKLDKEIKTALKKDIPYVLFIGEKELADEQYTLRDLKAEKEERHSLQRIVSIVKDYRKK
jgi:histidyl-tRNA synthetase